MKLFEPGRIGSLAIKNRIVMAPMFCMGMTNPSVQKGYSQRGVDYYTARAKGGTGLIITGVMVPSEKMEASWGFPVVSDASAALWLNEVAEAVHDYGPLHLTNRELDVMAVLWERESATVAEVLEALSAELAYTTVLTVLRGLEAKGHVRHESEGKAFRYFPTVEPATAGETVLGRVLDKIYQGSRELLVARLLADDAVSEAELRRIRQMLDERLGEVER